MVQYKMKKNKGAFVTVDFTLKNLTLGELLAMSNALANHNSPVGNDVLSYITNAIYELGDENIKKTIGDSVNRIQEEISRKDFTSAE